MAYRTISGFLLRRAGLTRTTGPTGAVTIVQRFRSALNLNVHCHLRFMDGVYLADGDDPPEFCVECERRRASRNRSLATGGKGSTAEVT